jgi:hypothetical protein
MNGVLHMSSNYMRQIMEAIDMAQNLNEGYEDRVQQVADYITKAYPNITRKQFPSAIEDAAANTGVVELRAISEPGLNQKVGDSRKEFMKDVAAQINFQRDTSKQQDKNTRRDAVLRDLVNIIDDAVGMSFPDGDPFDHIFPKARKLGIRADDVLEWLDRAVRKAGMGKSYHGYLKDLWDDQYGDARSDHERSPENPQTQDRYNSLGGDNYQNPWGS